MQKPRKFELRFKEIDGVLHKKCTKCFLFKRVEDEFTKAKNTSDKRTPNCNECRRKIFQDKEKKRKRYKEDGIQKKKIYYQQNKERIHEQRKEFFESNKESQLLRRARTFIRKQRLNTKEKSSSRSKEILGCSKKELFEYLKHTFLKVYGIEYRDEYFKDLHIDHIIPLSSANSEQEALKLNHYTNLQFLHKDHNMEKKAKMNYIIPKFPIEKYNK